MSKFTWKFFPRVTHIVIQLFSAYVTMFLIGCIFSPLTKKYYTPYLSEKCLTPYQ